MTLDHGEEGSGKEESRTFSSLACSCDLVLSGYVLIATSVVRVPIGNMGTGNGSGIGATEENQCSAWMKAGRRCLRGGASNHLSRRGLLLKNAAR